MDLWHDSNFHFIFVRWAYSLLILALLMIRLSSLFWKEVYRIIIYNLNLNMIFIQFVQRCEPCCSVLTIAYTLLVKPQNSDGCPDLRDVPSSTVELCMSEEHFPFFPFYFILSNAPLIDLHGLPMLCSMTISSLDPDLLLYQNVLGDWTKQAGPEVSYPHLCVRHAMLPMEMSWFRAHKG